jgi:DNA-binding transcriptional regulator GbsR (MarR family)
MEDEKILQEARIRLIETGGRTSQDLGTGRIVGQVLVHLYLQENECSLDNIAEDLGLSKASVSIAVRQLEQLGLARKIWKIGDKRNYYRSAENIGKALQQGLLSLVRNKIQIFGDELDVSLEQIALISEETPVKCDLDFLRQRIIRAKKLQSGLEKLLGNPLVTLLAGIRGK